TLGPRRCFRRARGDLTAWTETRALHPCAILYEEVFLLFVQYGAARARGGDAAVRAGSGAGDSDPGVGAMGVTPLVGDSFFRWGDTVVAWRRRHGGDPRRGARGLRARALRGDHGGVQSGERDAGEAGGVPRCWGQSGEPGSAVAGRFDPAGAGAIA